MSSSSQHVAWPQPSSLPELPWARPSRGAGPPRGVCCCSRGHCSPFPRLRVPGPVSRGLWPSPPVTVSGGQRPRSPPLCSRAWSVPGSPLAAPSTWPPRGGPPRAPPRHHVQHPAIGPRGSYRAAQERLLQGLPDLLIRVAVEGVQVEPAGGDGQGARRPHGPWGSHEGSCPAQSVPTPSAGSSPHVLCGGHRLPRY